MKYGYTSEQVINLEKLLKTLNSDGKINIGNEKEKIMVDFDVYMTQELPGLGIEPTIAECELNLKNYMELKKEPELKTKENKTIFELHEVIGFDDNGNHDENYDKLLYTFTSYEDAQNELNYQVEHGYAQSELEI
ncbi:hypothetical protein [Spiroplasma syrphidicola]|nr:hypothetical protein [Spiroplasma syrphidicola]